MKDSRENLIYIAITGLAFMAIVFILLLGKRSTQSELERRELAEFPEITAPSLIRGEAGPAVSEWYADTVPKRDRVLNMAMDVRNVRGIQDTGEETIRFHNVKELRTEPEETAQVTAAPAGEPEKQPEKEPEKTPENGPAANAGTSAGAENAPAAADAGQGSSDTADAEAAQTEAPAEHETPETASAVPEEAYDALPEEAFTVGSNGIIVSGSGSNTRAIMMYGGSASVAKHYAEVVSMYPEALPGVRVYCMVIPTAVSYYCPVQALSYTGSQLDQIRNIMESLSPAVTGINVYSVLGEHTEEPIYLRTDHHWAPLGAYYAAGEFAKAAGVPFPDLSSYEERVVHNYCGTMYMYSQDTAVRDNPEDFVYYVPRDLTLETTYINYTLSDGRVAAENPPFSGPFFQPMNDGNSNAYCVFMGGDAKITRVQTGIQNGRRLVILKDSFGNALPEFLFYGFEEVHVLDARYFTRNIVQYVQENGITDVLFANNVFHAGTKSTAAAYERFLKQ